VTESTLTYRPIIGWILFIPVACIMYLVSEFAISFSFTLVFGQKITDFMFSPNFNGYYILGPIFIILKEILAISFAVYSSIYYVPKHKLKVLKIFTVLWICFLFLGFISDCFLYLTKHLDRERLFRSIVEIFAMFFGFYLSVKYTKNQILKIQSKD
jgi:hypothetical protein